jgi:hypothetical protein
LHANPYGFAQWFTAQTPPDQDFGAFFEKRSLDYDRSRMLLLEKADAAPVPDQAPAFRKSRAVIALQLIKRWRNLAYDRRHKKLRLPFARRTADPATTGSAWYTAEEMATVVNS